MSRYSPAVFQYIQLRAATLHLVPRSIFWDLPSWTNPAFGLDSNWAVSRRPVDVNSSCYPWIWRCFWHAALSTSQNHFRVSNCAVRFEVTRLLLFSSRGVRELLHILVLSTQKKECLNRAEIFKIQLFWIYSKYLTKLQQLRKF